ncbi:MAG: cobalamin-binding protein [Candidatus Rokubacteria bacterium]|nr:cobalamin-binding protein [Candidatus Rokubacteria bacterium]MBI3824480.1 cobalamin-binding protein [Candidatus Rokubacteria bacterium]
MPPSRRNAGLAVGVLLALLSAATPAHAVRLRDMTGREVMLASEPKRIVSLVPSVTELIYALGGEERLVGVTDFCDWPPAARQKPSVGGMINPNLEVLATLRPDLVIATDAGNRQETFVHLRELGIAVYLVHARHLAEVMDVTARLGALTGREAAVAPVTAGLGRRIQAVTRAVAPFRKPRVLYVLWPEPLIVPGRDALIGDLILAAGGDSITAAEPSDYPRFSLEAAVARAPEVILLADHGSGTGAIPRQKWDRLTSLPAVRSGRIHSVNGTLLHRYGPRLVEGLEQLARAIHPEAFR